MVRMFDFYAYSSLLKAKGEGGGGGEGGGRGGEGTQQMFICLYGEAPPRDPTPYTFINHFFYVKGNSFIYLLLTNGISFTDLIN